jgi:hypothetical protein
VRPSAGTSSRTAPTCALLTLLAWLTPSSECLGHGVLVF